MRISRVQVRGYRSLSDVTVEIDGYTALIGPNGCGKSSVLLALNWFFNGGDWEPEDCHRPASASGSSDPSSSSSDRIQVSVTMTDLNDADREALGRYGRGDSATFRRTWKKDERDKIVGNAWQGPGFAAVRNAGDAKSMDHAYKELQPKVTGLTPQTTKGRITSELDRWEAENTDPNLLEEVDDADASHLFGINGVNKIKERVQLVFVPAAVDMQSEMNGTSKGTALQTLVGTLMSSAAAQARAEWAAKHADAITELNTAVTASIEKATGLQQSRVNERLSQMVPNASVEFRASMPAWAPRPDESISTHVAIDGIADHISRHGHGVQRSLLLAMLQALAPDSTLAGQQAAGTSSDEPLTANEQAVVNDALTDLPHLVICIEEPEIYQHPIRARAFARVLGELADSAGAQVILATHSPYFVAPRRFESLRLFSISGRATTAQGRSTIADVASRSGRKIAQVQKAIDLQLPGSFSEAFFGSGAVLVEGETDRVVIETLAERLGTPLDLLGCTIAAVGGKRNIPIAHAILVEVGVLSYPIIDGDALGAERKFGTAPTGDAVEDKTRTHNSNRSATEQLLTLMPSTGTASVGKVPHIFGASTTVSDTHTVWNDDIETELDQWPSFVAALTAIGGNPRSKNLHAYREAAATADPSDMPYPLRACIESIVRSFS